MIEFFLPSIPKRNLSYILWYNFFLPYILWQNSYLPHILWQNVFYPIFHDRRDFFFTLNSITFSILYSMTEGFCLTLISTTELFLSYIPWQKVFFNAKFHVITFSILYSVTSFFFNTKFHNRTFSTICSKTEPFLLHIPLQNYFCPIFPK